MPVEIVWSALARARLRNIRDYVARDKPDAAARLAKLPIKQIITTDTVAIPPEKMSPLEEQITILSVAPLLGEVIRRAHEGRSVGEMFNE